MVIRLEWLFLAWCVVGTLRDAAAINARAVLISHIVITVLAVLAIVLSHS